MYKAFRFAPAVFIFFLVLAFSAVPLNAMQSQNLGLSVVCVPDFRVGFGASLEYASSPDFNKPAPPVSMVYAARGDFAVAGSEIDGVVLSLMTGGGAVVHALDCVDATFYAGPSFLLYMGLSEKEQIDSYCGLGVGIAGNVSYRFANSGFSLGLGGWINCPIAALSERPVAFGGSLSMGITY